MSVAHNTGVSVKTPHSMVSIDDLLSSTVKGFEKMGILYQIQQAASRYVSGDVAGSLDSKAEVRASNVTILVKAGEYAPTIEDHMNKGEAFKKVTVQKLSNIKGTNVITEETAYENCMITEISPDHKVEVEPGVFADNLVRISFRFQKKTYKVIVYGQDGTKKGQNVSTFDYSTGTAG